MGRTVVATIICLVLLIVSSCRESPTASIPSTSPGLAASRGKPAESQPKGEPPSIQPSVPKDPRQIRLKEEWDASPDILISHSVAGLSDPERAMVENLSAAAQIIQELYMLQIHPENLTWWKAVQRTGTEIEKKVYRRNHGPWCVATEGRANCCALPKCPKKEIGLGMWPEGLTEKEYRGFPAQINGKEILSPFTFVRRGAGGGFDAVPFAVETLIRDKMSALAEHLMWAARVAPSERLKKFLESRSQAFLSNDPFPYDSSDYDWIALDGDWEVTVGPYETYKDPRGRKAFFQMYVGRVDRALDEDLRRFQTHLQEMEDALAKLVGGDVYRRRKLDPRIAIRAVDIWMAAGHGRSSHGVVAAYHLPNGGRAVEEGLYKKVLMVNHMKAFAPVTKRRADVILDPSQRAHLDSSIHVLETALHELSHGFGAYSDMRIVNTKGKRTTVIQALGQNETLIEELKADVFGRWLVRFQKERGWITSDQEKQYYVNGLMHILGLLQYPLSGVYSRMTAVQLGWYLDEGGVVWDKASERFRVDFAKIHGAVASLAVKVARIQLTGDANQAAALIGKYVQRSESGETELRGMVGKARAVMVKKFNKAHASSPTLRYELKGIRAQPEGRRKGRRGGAKP